MGNGQEVMVRAESPAELSVDVVKQQVGKIQTLMRDVMQDGQHFGVVPGTNKPTLLKPGAEKLAFIFRLAPEFQVTERQGERGHREYQVICTLTHMATGTFVGQGVGCCSTMEKKYRYRHESGFEILEEPIPEDYRNRKPEYRKQGYGAKKVDGQWVWVKYTSGEQVENPDIADTYNTVLKMAKKRAMVDAVLTSTAASDIFTQDVEDFAEQDVRPADRGSGQPQQTTNQHNGRPQNKYNGHTKPSGSSDPVAAKRMELFSYLNEHIEDSQRPMWAQQIRAAADLEHLAIIEEDLKGPAKYAAPQDGGDLFGEGA